MSHLLPLLLPQLLPLPRPVPPACQDPELPWRQFHVYELCLERYRLRHQWMAFFDTDEFLMIKNTTIPDLPTFLKVGG